MGAPSADSSRRCSAHNRAGERCGRWTAPGCRVCHFHGAGGGPKTPEGRATGLTNRIVHGARTSLSTYQRLLAVADPDAYAAVPNTSTVGDELRFARARLVTLAAREAAGEEGLTGPILETLDLIRRYALAQREVSPGGEATGAFEIAIRVVGEDPENGQGPCTLRLGEAEASEGEASQPPALDPMDPPGAAGRGTKPYRDSEWRPVGGGRA